MRSIQWCHLSGRVHTDVEKEPLHSASPPSLATSVASSLWYTLDANGFRLQHNVCTKEVYYERDIPLHYTSYHASFFLYPTVDTMTSLQNSKLLANQNPAFLCRSESRVGPVANHWQGGDFYFHFFWPTRHPHLTCYQSHLTRQSSSDTSFFPTKEGFLHLQTFQGFCPSEKTFKDSQFQVIAEESAVRV